MACDSVLGQAFPVAVRIGRPLFKLAQNAKNVSDQFLQSRASRIFIILGLKVPAFEAID